jgi:hypothetical protein
MSGFITRTKEWHLANGWREGFDAEHQMPRLVPPDGWPLDGVRYGVRVAASQSRVGALFCNVCV